MTPDTNQLAAIVFISGSVMTPGHYAIAWETDNENSSIIAFSGPLTIDQCMCRDRTHLNWTDQYIPLAENEYRICFYI